LSVPEIATLRVIAVAPPSGVRFGVQRGAKEIVLPILSTGEDIVFDLSLPIRDNRADGLPNFLGPFAHGTPVDRFLYIASGTLAGQSESPWTRRAKIALSGIGWNLITEASHAPGRIVEARFAATARDGGPACASVPLLDGGWRLSS
jgi:hypothetical protein